MDSQNNYDRLPSRRLFLAGSIASSAGLVACSTAFDPYKYSLKLTIAAFGRLHVGSSVTWVGPYLSRSIDGSTFRTNIEGEATAVECGPGQYVFALLRGLVHPNGPPSADRLWTDEPTALLMKLYGLAESPVTPHNRFKALAGAKGPATIELDQLPTIVSFADINDPTTSIILDPNGPLIRVDPYSKIVKAEIEITNDPITHKLQNILPWISSEKSSI